MARVTNNKTPSFIATRLVEIAEKYNIKESDILFDLYNVFESGGSTLMGNDKVLEELRTNDPARYWNERNAFYQAKIVLGDITESPVFNSFKNLGPLDAVEAIAELMNLMWKRVEAFKEQQSQRVGRYRREQGQLPAVPGDMSRESWTRQEIEETLEKRKDLDRKLQEKQMSIADFLNGIRNTLEALDSGVGFAQLGVDPTKMVKQPESGKGIGVADAGAGKSPFILPFGSGDTRKDAQFLLGCAKNFILHGGSVLWDMIKNIGDKGGFETAKRTVTDDVTDEKKESQMTRTEEVTSVNPSDIQREDFDKRLVEKSLDVVKHTGEESEKAHSIVLLDVSGSMLDTDTALGRMQREAYALAIIVALAQKVLDRGDKFHIIPFAGRPAPTIDVENKEQVPAAIDKALRSGAYGGTSIPSAFTAAFNLIKSEEHYRRCDVLLITDAQDDFYHEDIINRKPEKTRIIGIHVGERVSDIYKVRIEKICDKGRFLNGGWDVVNNMPEIKSALEGL